MTKEHKRLGDLLIEAELITPQDLSDAIAEQRRTGELLGATLIRMGRISEPVLMKHLQSQLGLPLVDLGQRVADEQALALIKEELARKYVALPLEIESRSTLVVAMADPLNVAALEDLRFHSGMFIRPLLATSSSIREAIEHYYHIDNSVNEVISNIISSEEEVVVSAVRDDEQAEAIDDLIREAEGRPIVRLTNWILHRAVEERASDIHMEPQERHLVIRFRVDGLLHEVQRLPKWTQGAVVSRIKVLSNLDIAEKRQPQDGRLAAEIRGRRVDMRVSTLPTTHGEKVVIRVVDQQRVALELDQLGFLPDDLDHVRRHLERPQGILLVTGPTGSGKSTLLYSALRHVQHETKNIVSVEDPVEYQIPGINQVQVDEKAKKTFPAALRAILRQDPDVIMIGEIRDRETAQIAFRASVTGHLVLSTVHTNDAAGAVTRLVDLGLEPFMVATSLIGVVAMRLVRTLCPRCLEPYEVNASNLNRLGARELAEGTVLLHRGRGCPHCRHTGYQGRIGIFEVLEVNETIRTLINQNAADATIRHAAIEAGMRSIGEDGLKKVLGGSTTLEEVTRVVYLADQGAKVCPSCTMVLAKDYEYCPSCGEFVGEHCESCRRRVHPGWTFCPFCGEPSAQGAAEAQREVVDDRTRRVARLARRRGAEPPLKRAS
ncbi:MAG TPA: ATPase, T2SS/T4P/T4SS family [Candidatus Eisenbacteria bacterium]|jgi:type IV pilus assembly protein PilB